MPKNIKGTSSLVGKNVQNSESIGNLTADTIRTNTLVATNATITNLTNTELQTATTNIATNVTNIATNASAISTNTSNISTNASAISTNTSNISTNASAISTNATSIAGKQDTITAGDGLSFVGATLNAEVTQAEVDAKQDTITSSTSLSCADINCNSNSLTGVTSMSCQSLEIHNTSNLLSFLDFGSGDFKFRSIYNENGNHYQLQLRDANGLNNQKKLQINYDSVDIHNAEFDLNSNDIVNVNSLNTITSTEIGYLDGVTSSIQTQLDSKLTSGGAASFSSLNLNSGNLTNGGTGNFTAINLNGSDLQGKIDDKADLFGLLLPLEISTGGIPFDAISLKYDTSQFTLNASDELSLNGAVPSDITSADYISFFVNGETVASDNFSLKLRADGKVKIKSGDLDMANNKVTNVSEIENAVRIMEFGGDPDSVTNNLWGNDNIHDTWATSIDVNGSGMVTESSGVFTITEAGTYTITVNCVVEDQTYNNRIVAGMYLSLNDDTSRFRGATSGTSFALCYLRFDDYGFGESMTFSLTEVFSANDTIRFKTKLGTNSDARNYNDTLADNKLKWWAGARFQKLLRA